jgi:purine-nucleoside phosphorylase
MNILRSEIENNFYKAASRTAPNMIFFPKIAIIAGSGLMDSLKDIEISQSISYSSTGILPDPSVEGHQKELLLARYNNHKILIFSGRFHLYEGYSPLETAYPIILAYYLGIKNIILTNAAGGVSHKLDAGDLMLIDDLIDLTYKKYYHNFSLNGIASKLHQDSAFDKNWINSTENKMLSMKTPFKKGVYTQVTGPNYETRAEIRMLRKISSDAVGMSTGIEAQFASALGMNCIAGSMITNKSSDIVKKEVTHKEVLQTAEDAAWKMRNFIYSAVETAALNT